MFAKKNKGSAWHGCRTSWPRKSNLKVLKNPPINNHPLNDKESPIWFATMKQTASVPVNVRITPKPLTCYRQKEIDAHRLQELLLEFEDLCIARRYALDGDPHLAATKTLDAWNMSHRDELNRLLSLRGEK